jgi:hypothetical protein
MSLHALDAINRQNDGQLYVAPVEPELAPLTKPATPEAGQQANFVERVVQHIAHLALRR